MSDKPSDIKQEFLDVCTELGCEPDNEAALMAVADLKRRLQVAEGKVAYGLLAPHRTREPMAGTPGPLPDHPMQPVIRDADGVLRFRRNLIVDFLADQPGCDMNTLHWKGFPAEDWAQFIQLIGMSVAGSRGYIAQDILTALAGSGGQTSAIGSARPVQARSVQEAIDNFVASLPPENKPALIFLNNEPVPVAQS